MSLEWEIMIVRDVGGLATYRLKVEGGWLYRCDGALEFVPAKDLNARTPPSQNIQTPFPMGRRFTPMTVQQPKPAKKIIDAEFEEIPEHRVNGSKVTTATRVD